MGSAGLQGAYDLLSVWAAAGAVDAPALDQFGVSAMLRSAIVWLDRKPVQRFSGEAVSASPDALALADICIMTADRGGSNSQSMHVSLSYLRSIRSSRYFI